MTFTRRTGHGVKPDLVPDDARGYYARSGAYPPNMQPLQESRDHDRGPAPRTVLLACTLIVAFGVVNATISVTTPVDRAIPDGLTVWFLALSAVSTLALALVLARFLRKGSRAARVVLLVIAGLNVAGAFVTPAYLAGQGLGADEVLLEGLSVVLVLLASALVFTPSARAFFARSGFSA